MKNKQVEMNINDIIMEGEIFDKICHRIDYSYVTVAQYQSAIKIGKIFPPVKVGRYKGSIYLIDGRHTILARKGLKFETVMTIPKTYQSIKDMTIDALKFNGDHGLPMSVRDRVYAFIKLKNYNLSEEEISSILSVPTTFFQFFESRIIVKDGKEIPIGKIISQSLEKGYVQETDVARIPNIEELKSNTISDNETKHLFQQIIFLSENKLINWNDPEIFEVANELYKILNKNLGLKIHA